MQVLPRGRVLIVDDEDRVADRLREYLEKYLLYTRTAHSVRQALDELCMDRFDVVVLDWILPDGDGRRVLEFAKSQSPETVTIVYSAHRTSDAECTAARADHFVEKSHDTSQIRNAVERGLAQSAHTITPLTAPSLAPSLPRQSLWKVLHDSLPAISSEHSQFLVMAQDDSLASGYLRWLLQNIDGTRNIFEIDATELQAETGSAMRCLFGECSLSGQRRPSVTRGILDPIHPQDVLVHHAQHLSEDVLRVLADAMRSGRFQRVGSDRDLDLRARVSLTAGNSPEHSTQFQRNFGGVSVLQTIEIPDSPQSLHDGSMWINKLLDPSDRRRKVNSSVLQLFCKLPCALSWSNLRALVEVVDESRSGTPATWMTAFPFFEAALCSTKHGELSKWKEVSDIPRLIYVSWLLNETSGNVAEAARLSGLTRPAIYAAIRNGNLDQEAFRVTG